ncbi:MAG: hypothetical protein V3U19_10180 [Thermodesulfobacteriota bacterium]
MSKPRKWYTYEFKKGNKLLHGGRTQDPKGHLKIIGKAKTEEGAIEWERKQGHL